MTAQTKLQLPAGLIVQRKIILSFPAIFLRAEITERAAISLVFGFSKEEEFLIFRTIFETLLSTVIS